MSVLDVGCGQGTQAIHLASLGCDVIGIEPSARMREVASTAASDAGVALELLAGPLADASELVDGRRFDLVCAHGLLMYLPDSAAALVTLAGLVADGGLLSFTVRNGDALAMRHGMRGEWGAALQAFHTLDYVNGLGVEARADRLDDVRQTVANASMEILAWYGIRVLSDGVANDEPPPPPGEELRALLDAEDLAGRRDPYRAMGAQYHIVARRVPG